MRMAARSAGPSMAIRWQSRRHHHCRRHLPLDALHRSAAAAREFGHLENAMTSAKLPADGLLDLRPYRRATELFDPLLADTVQDSHDTRPDHLPFQFTEHAGHLHHGLPEWAGAVDRLLV